MVANLAFYKNKDILISGITGQDGSYLAELLLEHGAHVYGTTRDPGLNKFALVPSIRDKVKLEFCSYSFSSVEKIINKIKPDVVFNLCGQAYVLKSWEMEEETIHSAGLIPLYFLKAITELKPECRFFQASSSEIFDQSSDQRLLNEDSPINPRTPYGCAKALSHHLVASYRQNYGLYAVSGILFNHESSRRKENFLSRKVIQAAIAIKEGRLKSLELGNLETKRDWGYAKEYVEAMAIMMAGQRPKDYIIASGFSYQVKDLVEIVFSYLGLDYQKYIVIDKKLVRPFEPKEMHADPSLIYKDLKWKAKLTFKEVLHQMIDEEKKI